MPSQARDKHRERNHSIKTSGWLFFSYSESRTPRSTMTWCEKRLSFRAIHILKTIILPRQARDKCRETLEKREALFEQAALNQGIARQVRDSDDDAIIAATTANLSFLCFLLCLELFAGVVSCVVFNFWEFCTAADASPACAAE